ncbi:MAG: carboxy terminal-processing peptidase [Pirellulales bacterium]|nr:carboxy terminal-processing peptidase [Planctomycetales bacterium]
MTQRTTAPSSLRRHLGLGLLALVLLVTPQLKAAELKGPTPQDNDRYVTKAVVRLLQHIHLSKHPLDDEISQRCLDSFLKGIDPWKLYLLDSDVAEFRRRQTQLDEALKAGDVTFAYEVYNRFLDRVDHGVALADEFLNADLDFGVDEEMITDPDATTYAQSEQELRDRWRKRVKYDLLVKKSEDVSPEEAREQLRKRYHASARRLRTTKPDELLERYLTALTTSYDPHTTYMAPSTLENFEISMRLELEGIGAALSWKDGDTIVSKIIPGGAAAKDGRLQPDDRITGVAQGEDGEFVDIVDMSLNDVVQLIRGKRDTVVRLRVVPADASKPQTYDITRAKIELTDSEAQGKVFEQGQKPDGSAFRVGVISLPSFYMDMSARRDNLANYRSTTRDVRKILQDFKGEHVDAVVMDLRRNGGGSLTEAIDVTGLFIDRGPVVQVKDSDGRVQQVDDETSGAEWDGPLVVLISKFSASASEIFAGAIKDYERGIIIGDDSTHGKGTVQSLLDLSDKLFRQGPELGALKITQQQFYRPNGSSTQREGVKADVILPSRTAHYEGISESDLDYALQWDHVDAASFPKLKMVDRAAIDQLSMLSKQRVEQSSDFQHEQEWIKQYEDRKNRKTVSLNEEKFLADRAEINAQKDQEDALEEIANGDSSDIKRDYYLDEALAITVDYLKLFRVAGSN